MIIMSKKMKTIEQLRAEIEALQKNYEAQKAAEAENIGRYIHNPSGVETLAAFRGAYEIQKIGGEA